MDDLKCLFNPSVLLNDWSHKTEQCVFKEINKSYKQGFTIAITTGSIQNALSKLNHSRSNTENVTI